MNNHHHRYVLDAETGEITGQSTARHNFGSQVTVAASGHAFGYTRYSTSEETSLLVFDLLAGLR
jgi:hypothetical protein